MEQLPHKLQQWGAREASLPPPPHSPWPAAAPKVAASQATQTGSSTKFLTDKELLSQLYLGVPLGCPGALCAKWPLKAIVGP